LFVIHLAGGKRVVGRLRVTRGLLGTPKPTCPSSSRLGFLLVLFISSPLFGKLFASSLAGDGTIESNIIVFQFFLEFVELFCILKSDGKGIMTSVELEEPPIRSKQSRERHEGETAAFQPFFRSLTSSGRQAK